MYTKQHEVRNHMFECRTSEIDLLRNTCYTELIVIY